VGALVDGLRDGIESRLGLCLLRITASHPLQSIESSSEVLDRGGTRAQGPRAGHSTKPDASTAGGGRGSGFVRAHWNEQTCTRRYVTRAREAVKKALDEAGTSGQAAPSASCWSWTHQNRVKETGRGSKGLSKLTTLYPDESQVWADLAQAYSFSNQKAGLRRSRKQSRFQVASQLLPQKANALRRLAVFKSREAEAEAERLNAEIPGGIGAKILFEKATGHGFKNLDAARGSFEKAATILLAESLDLANSEQARRGLLEVPRAASDS